MLPTHEPPREHKTATAGGTQPAHQHHAQQVATEILGNTVDPYWRFSTQTVPTLSSLTVPGGLPFGFVVQPFAAPEDSSRSDAAGVPWACLCAARPVYRRAIYCVCSLAQVAAARGRAVPGLRRVSQFVRVCRSPDGPLDVQFLRARCNI